MARTPHRNQGFLLHRFRAFAGTNTLALGMLIVSTAVAPSSAFAQEGDHGEWGKGKPKSAAPDAGKDKKEQKRPATEKERLKDEAQDLFKQPGAGSGAADGAASGAKGWAVVITVFRGETRDKDAAETLAQMRAEGRLADAYIVRRGEATMIAVGDYPSADDERAQAELHRVQAMEINGGRPYAGAILVPPLEWKMAGGLPQFNLASARKAHPEALYTLQIAAYGRLDLPGRPTEEDLKESRKAAEDAAAKLRQEGEEAFYYHGPTMSMVCVGAFDESDFDPQVPTLKSSRLRDAQKRHPYNLYNGKGTRVKYKGGRTEIQPSSLVEIPK